MTRQVREEIDTDLTVTDSTASELSAAELSAAPQALSSDVVTTTQQLTWTRAVFWVLMLMFVAFQHRMWVGEGSYAEVWRLKTEIEKQEQENHVLGERNRRLTAEVKDLREGRAAVEERARKQLGMIKSDETLYIVNEKTPKR